MKEPNPMRQTGWFIFGLLVGLILLSGLLTVTDNNFPLIYWVLAHPIAQVGVLLFFGFHHATAHHKKAMEQYRADRERWGERPT